MMSFAWPCPLSKIHLNALNETLGGISWQPQIKKFLTIFISWGRGYILGNLKSKVPNNFHFFILGVFLAPSDPKSLTIFISGVGGYSWWPQIQKSLTIFISWGRGCIHGNLRSKIPNNFHFRGYFLATSDQKVPDNFHFQGGGDVFLVTSSPKSLTIFIFFIFSGYSWHPQILSL